MYNDFNKYLCAARIQGYIPKDELKDNINSYSEVLLDKDLSHEESDDMGQTNYEKILELSSPITQEVLEALKQRYIDVSKNAEYEKNEEIPYYIDGSTVEIDDGKIDSDYFNSKFTKFLKTLKYNDCSAEELEKALNSLHKSFASLSQEQQKYANMVIHDIESGDLIIEDNKTFMDYITQYATSAENDQIKKLANSFGLDENKLRNMMKLPISANNINEYGRFDDLLRTVDEIKAKETLEKLYNRSFEIWESNMETQKILREFILKGGFDLNKTIEK